MNQDELSLTVLSNFDLLATSAHYDRKNDDLHKLCVLPAWQKPDLKLYATQLMNPAVSSETFDHYYEHSGGSLRNFITAGRGGDLAEILDILSSDVQNVPYETVDAIFSVYGASRGAGLDRLQRTYVIDRSNAKHYSERASWRKVVDSFVARKGLSLKIALDSIKGSMKLAKLSGVASWYGWAFEEYVHKMASLSSGVIRMYPYAVADRVKSGEVTVGLDEVVNFQCIGNGFKSCMEFLKRNSTPGLYWRPDYAQYPALDAVLFLPSTKTVLYIQTTVSKSYTFSHRLVNKTHSRLIESVKFLQDTSKGGKKDTRTGGVGVWTYAYVVIVPSKEDINTFKNKVGNGAEIDQLRGRLYVGYIDEKGQQDNSSK
jgi:hypothetical protein